MTNTLSLLRDGAPIAERTLGDEALEIGSAAGCDWVIDDLPARALLVQARAGSVWLYELAHARLERRVLALDRPFALGARHALLRRFVARPHGAGGETQPLAPPPEAPPRFTLLVGRGAEARKLRVGEQPIRIGAAAHNELVLYDVTVSAEHCRLEPAGGALLVRDLGSTNGTFVQGVRVDRARLSAGARLRVGRTDLQLVVSDEGERGERGLVVASAAMQEVLAEARRFALLPWPVLLLGPSGVGKEELAALIHREGGRPKGPFVALNAGGLPRELVESELFGHERGAYTGAHALRRGVFEQAHGGTLFLDEIGELPIALQSRLLRVLETWTVRRVGSEQETPVDVRLVCATHRDLLQMGRAGSFRQDLYYRLANLVLRVSPLCERPEDVIALARHFVRGLAGEIGGRQLSADAEARLLAHAWPGNARELRNVLRSAAALSAGPQLDATDIERALARVSGPVELVAHDPQAMQRAVAHYKGNLSAASRALNIPRSTLRDRLRKPVKS